jgi:hypothetical protein
MREFVDQACREHNGPCSCHFLRRPDVEQSVNSWVDPFNQRMTQSCAVTQDFFSRLCEHLLWAQPVKSHECPEDVKAASLASTFEDGGQGGSSQAPSVDHISSPEWNCFPGPVASPLKLR